jgi:hypothetical protein
MIAPTPLRRSSVDRISWWQWMLATAAGSTLGAVVGGALITMWLQPFQPVSDPLATAQITIPRIAGSFAVWGAGIGIVQAALLRRRLAGAYWWPSRLLAAGPSLGP